MRSKAFRRFIHLSGGLFPLFSGRITHFETTTRMSNDIHGNQPPKHQITVLWEPQKRCTGTSLAQSSTICIKCASEVLSLSLSLSLQLKVAGQFSRDLSTRKLQQLPPPSPRIAEQRNALHPLGAEPCACRCPQALPGGRRKRKLCGCGRGIKDDDFAVAP